MKYKYNKTKLFKTSEKYKLSQYKKLFCRYIYISNDHRYTTGQQNKDHRWLQALQRVIPKVNILHQKEQCLNLSKFCNLVEKLIINHGETEAISRLKQLRLNLQQFVLDQEITPRPFTKVDKDHYPKTIKFLKPNRSDLNSIRYSVSFMRTIELFKGKPRADTKSITGASTACPETINDIQRFIQKCSWLKSIKPVNKGYLPLSNHAGPNGPASISALEDLAALRNYDQPLLSAIEQQLLVTVP